jgi:hypothetical protein
VSAGLIALGKANTAERRCLTQLSPISFVSIGGGWTRQFVGSFSAGNRSTRLSSHSKQKALYFSLGVKGLLWTKTSSAAVD